MLRPLPTRAVIDKPSTPWTDPNKLKLVKELKFVTHTKNNSNKFKTKSKEDPKPVATTTKSLTHQESSSLLQVPKTPQLPRVTL